MAQKNDESWHQYRFAYSGRISQEKWDKAFGREKDEKKIKCSRCKVEFGATELSDDGVCIACLQAQIALEYLSDLDNTMLC